MQQWKESEAGNAKRSKVHPKGSHHHSRVDWTIMQHPQELITEVAQKNKKQLIEILTLSLF